MLKIESNLKINGRHWGLQFADGIAYTANVALAAKLLLKGYVVTDRQPEAEHNVAGEINVIQKASTTPAPPKLEKPSLQTERPDQPVAASIITNHELSPAPSSPAQADTGKTISQPATAPTENTVAESQPKTAMDHETGPNEYALKETAKAAKPKTTKPRKRAVKPDAADAG